MRCTTVLIIVSVITIFSCKKKPSSSFSQGKSIAPLSVGELPLLGMGYNPVEKRLTGTSCIQGWKKNRHVSREVNLEFHKNLTAEEVGKLLSAYIEIGYPVFPGIMGIAGLGLNFDFAETSYRDSTTIYYHINEGALSANADPDAVRGYTFHPSLRYHYDRKSHDPARSHIPIGPEVLKKTVQEMCGSEYVSAINYGISIIATVAIEYTNRFDSKQFKGTIGAELIGGLIRVTGTVDIGAAFRRIRAKIKLFVKQIGGDPTKLYKAIYKERGDASSMMADKEKPSEVSLTCLTKNDDWQRCQKYILNVLDYIKTLPQQADSADLGGEGLGNFAPLSFQTAPYIKAGKMGKIAEESEPPSPDDKAKAAKLENYRKTILSAESEYRNDFNRLNNVLTRAGRMASSLKFRTQQAAVIAQSALRYIGNEAQPACWTPPPGTTDIDECRKKVEVVEKKSADEWIYDKELLEPYPNNIKHWCQNALLPTRGVDVSNRQLVLAINRIVPKGEDLSSIGMQTEDVFGEDLTEEDIAEIKAVRDVDADAGSVPSDPSPELSKEEKQKNKELVNSVIKRCSDIEKYFLQIDEATKKVKITSLALDRAEDQDRLESLLPLSVFGNIQSLSVKSHNITDVKWIWGMNQLLNLNLADNRVSNLIQFAKFDQMHLSVAEKTSTLNLSKNDIETVEEALNHKKWRWNKVDLSNNRINTIIKQINSPKLIELNLSDNEFLRDVSGLADIQQGTFTLILKGTSIKECPFTQTQTRKCIL